ncbi:DUF1385 domain-containing protein [Paenibacillus antri]|uniref:DUF1385 domain-containing protein n=1 Tax=Paenibacillus antri TaxID=2582848 RepID=A0A5R9GFN8_9BACL|nr:DUF1385 domain-containing protein [Paenibacillus antri]TLS52980.1 DUF1385 domain-containing protein [Paenibacillus antri]
MSEVKAPVAYGGQAVIEGVMFAGRTVNVTAVRKKDRSIAYFESPRTEKAWVTKLKKVPLLRGIVALLDSSAKGSQHLNFSAESYAEGEAGESGEVAPKEPEKKSMSDNLTMILGVAVVGVLSFLAGKLIFTLVPAALESMLFEGSFESIFLHNLIEGGIKLVLLIGYILLIAQTPLIKRLFQYHGAEHKVITAYENGDPLTVENVQKYNTLHYRCGSSFLVLTVLVGILLYSLPIFTWDSIWERLGIRILLLPVVIGVSYEVLRFTNSVRDIPLLRYLGYPGLWLQLLTTKQPTDDQVEVAIASFQRMLEADRNNAVRLVEPGKAVGA